ncbi:MAG: hypothetical protein ACE5LH_01990 [Fidelibacterota bacterium]
MKKVSRLLVLLPVWLITALPGQTVYFDHTLHVEDVGISCNTCHRNKLIKKSLHASDDLLPEEKRCTSRCHQAWREENKCDMCHVGPPPYQTYPPREVVYDFPHKTHAVDERIACEVCHGTFKEEGTRPKIPAMTDCISCHQESLARTSCITCHDHPEDLRPADHTPFWLTQHRFAALQDDETCTVCHTEATCDNCHSGGTLSRDDLTGLNPYPSFRPDGSNRGQVLIRNHDLNYEYFHGLDAKSQARDCQVCHTVEFCSDCHRNENDILLNKPDFHGGPDWGAVRYPYGTDFANVSGGRHAELARRDMESCQACHDIEGGDPTCVDCHMDRDGIRGTDPKTHRAGFMNGVRGDWHDTDVSLCFTCHENTHQKGEGFCGYCHP